MELPKEFISNLDFLNDKKNDLLSGLKTSPVISLRLNENKKIEIKGEPVFWAKNGLYLDERPAFIEDPLFHAGCFYPQEASSMYIEQFFKSYDFEGKIGLDLCAAPGGKSTHLLSMMPDNSILVSNEVIKSRAWILKENIDKWGAINSVVTNNDPKDFSELKGLFDFVVIDAPCSGEGMFRKDPNAIEEWSLNNVEVCYNRQRRILADVWPCLKNGAMIIYSTCTFNQKENQENIKWISDNFEITPLKEDVETFPGIHQTEVEGIKCYNFLPGLVKGEGFFVTGFIKNEGETEFKVPKKSKKSKAKKIELGKEFLRLGQDLISFRENIVAFPSNFVWLEKVLARSLSLFKLGTAIGSELKNELKFSHELAFSSKLDLDSIEKIELDKDEAQKFLQKQDVKPKQLPKKWAIVTYNGFNLGFVKAAGNRVNNYYPKEFRIRKDLNN